MATTCLPFSHLEPLSIKIGIEESISAHDYDVTINSVDYFL